MPDLAGKTLGSYRIIEQIGLGGMATVYKAYQPSMDRYVALKVLSTHLTQEPTFVKRFQQEARVIAKLEHLHILPVYDHGEEDGYLYLVMRFIEAGTLKDHLGRGPVSLEETRRVVTQVGSALEYAHQLGVVHRDLKPSNILIDPQGDCYLTDFGIAKMVEGTLGLTGSGVLGTPHYMAPEQSQSARVDHRADVYAMGVVIFEMVTGQLPFDAETPFAVAMKHITEPLPLPRSIRPDLPEGLERVILKALAKDPADRYQSMRDLVAALDQAVQGIPTEVRTGAAAPPLAGPVPTIVDQAEAEPTALVPGQTTTGAWQQRLGAQPLWLLAIAGLALVVLVAAGLILSRIPGRVEISGGQVQVVLPSATPTPAAEIAPPATPAATEVAKAVPVASPTPTIASLPPALAGLRWEPTYDGETFLRVGLNAMAVDPDDPGTLFAGTYGAGIYVSRDGGQSWAPSNAGLGKGTVSRLAIDPHDSNVVYAALFDQGGVYKSTDGGRTWGTASTGIDLDRSWDWTALISIDPSDSQRLYYAGATEGFYLSTNGGQRWTRQSADCPQVMEFVVDPADFGHIYAANHQYSGPECLSGVYESTDGGQTWEPLTTAEMMAMDEFGGEPWHVAADPRDFGTLYAGNHLFTYRSSDRGRTWTQIREDGCDWLATNPGDGTLYCGQGGGLHISHDGGGSWSSADLGGWGRWNSHPLAVAPDDPQTLYAGSDAVKKSGDGGATWLRVGWLGVTRSRLTVDPRDGSRLFLGGVDSPCETYRSEDGGETWQVVVTDADGCLVVVDPAQDLVYRPDRSRGLYRSRDNGQTFEQVGSGYHDTFQLVPDPQEDQKLWAMAGCGARPFLSEDGGATFVEVESFPEEICGDPILLAHPDGRRIYVQGNGVVYRSDDGGGTWRRLVELGGMYRAGALDPTDPDVVYFGSTHKGVLRTADGGRTWAQMNSGLTNLAINELAVDPAHPQTVYAATGGGAFVSLDGGEGWWPIQAGLGPNPIVYSIAVGPNDSSKVYAVTPDGVFRLIGAPPLAEILPPPSPPSQLPKEGLIAERCDEQICVRNLETGEVTQLTDDMALDETRRFAWSPDGQQIVFSAGSAPGIDDLKLYLISADGSGLRQITSGDTNDKLPAWSPDGEWISFHRYCDLWLMRPDGSDARRLLERSPQFCAEQAAWSPSGQRLAFSNNLGTGTPLSHREVWVVDQDGTDPHVVYSSEDPLDWMDVAWSPDGQRLACWYQDGRGEGEKGLLLNADGSGEAQMVTEAPWSWFANYWPQWGGGVRAAEQARAFAEPILAAVADRAPDFQDDFGDRESGWPGGSTPAGDEWGYQDGAYFISATYRPQGGCCISVSAEPAALFSDFVLELDARFVSGERGMWGVAFRDLSGLEPPGNHYAVGFLTDGSYRVWKNIGGAHTELKEAGDDRAFSPAGGPETNHLTIVAQGSRVAFTMNGEPVWLLSDPSASRGKISLVVENLEPDTVFRADFDNLKVWDISGLAPPSAEAGSTAVPAGQCRVAYEEDGDIYVRECDGTGERRLTDHPAGERYPAWSPDGTRIVFYSNRENVSQPGREDINDLFLVNADGSGLTRLTAGDDNDMFPDWSPDGGRIAFHGNCGLLLIDPEGGYLTPIRARGDSPCVEYPTWSPDGRRLAFTSWQPEPGRTVFVINEDGSGLLELAHFQAGHALAVWSPDGQGLGLEVGLDDGTTRYYLLNADGSGEPAEVPSIPDSWYPWYWPRWSGE